MAQSSKVRREPHDDDGVTTPSTEDETNFSAIKLQSGVLEDWVNGKLETDLPASVNYERAVKVTISHFLIIVEIVKLLPCLQKLR